MQVQSQPKSQPNPHKKVKLEHTIPHPASLPEPEPAQMQGENDNESAQSEKPEDRLVWLLKKLKQENPTNIIDMLPSFMHTITQNENEIEDISGKIAELGEDYKEIMNKNGLLIFPEIFTSKAFKRAREAALTAYRIDFEPLLSEEVKKKHNYEELIKKEDAIFEIVKNPDLWKTGMLGNISFGFMFSQPEDPKEVHKLELDPDVNLNMSMGSGYNANLALLRHKTSRAALLLLSVLSGGSMIAQDSFKIGVNKTSELTQLHTDVYNNAERMQAMAIGDKEGAVNLCFLEFSHLPEVVQIIEEICGTELESGTGFCKIKDKPSQNKIIEAFKKAGCIQYGGRNSMVTWLPHVFHLELNNLTTRNSTTAFRERYVIGMVYIPEEFRQYMIKLAYAASRGFIIHPYYIYSKGNHPIAKVLGVHAKKTQFFTRRPQSDDEKERFKQVQEFWKEDNLEAQKEWVASAQKLSFKLMGVRSVDIEEFLNKQ